MATFEQIPNPLSFADLILTRAYPTWCQPQPPDNPTKHRKTYTFLRGMAYVKDQLVDALMSAAYCHLVSQAPADALDELGATYGGLARALIDTDTTYRAYLRGPVGRWHTFGTVPGLVAELAHCGYTAQVISWRDLVDAGAGAPGTVFGGDASFFYVALMYPSGPFSNAAEVWAGGTNWSNTPATYWGGAAGSNLANAAEEIRRVIKMVKPGHTSCRFVAVGLDNTFAINAQKLPTGNFGIIVCNEDWERVRPDYAYHLFYSFSPLVP